VDHVIVWRWVQRYAPELDRRLRKRLKATNDSWRVDSTGATIDFLLSAKRDAAAAERFLTKALGGENHPAPRVINTDKHAAYPPAIVELKADGVLEENSKHRPVQYLNNILEQDHRAIKTPGARKPTFSFVLGSSAYDRRLRSDSYDPQRPSVLQCRSTAPLHSRAVRGGELNCRRRFSPRLQTCNTAVTRSLHDSSGSGRVS
jgi:hypothetical protein